MAKIQIVIILCLIILSGLFCGCSRKVLGVDVSETPSHEASLGIKRGEAISNATAFITGAALAVLAASGKDWQISSYAVRHTPVYGSGSNAQKASDALSVLSAGIAAFLYAVKNFPPYGGFTDYSYRQIHIDENGAARLRLGTVEAFEAAALSGIVALPTTDLMKKYVGRPRPDNSENESFPSGHAAFAAWANAYSAKMVGMMDLPPHYRYPAYGALAAMTLGTAWGRVEGARHYPSDVLAGILISICLTDAAFAAFQEDGGQVYDTKFSIRFTNVRAVTTTSLTTTIDF